MIEEEGQQVIHAVTDRIEHVEHILEEDANVILQDIKRRASVAVSTIQTLISSSGKSSVVPTDTEVGFRSFHLDFIMLIFFLHYATTGRWSTFTRYIINLPL